MMGRPAIGRLAMGVGALFLCVGLAACDEKIQTKTVTIEKPCNCTRPTAVEDDYYSEPRHVRHRAKAHKRHHAGRRHHYAHRQRDEFYAGGYHGESAEIQGRSYSRSYREERRYHSEEEQRPLDSDARYSHRSRSNGQWVDGYGRVHYRVASLQTGPMVVNSRQGRSTWHGYGVRCKNPSHHHDIDGDYDHHDHSKVGHGFD